MQCFSPVSVVPSREGWENLIEWQKHKHTFKHPVTYRTIQHVQLTMSKFLDLRLEAHRRHPLGPGRTCKLHTERTQTTLFENLTYNLLFPTLKLLIIIKQHNTI